MPKYNSISTIPAKTFFEVFETRNWQLLKPKPRESGLEQVFVSIHDDFFIKSDNEEAKRYLELSKTIAGLEYKIAVLKQSLHFYYYNKTTKQMREDFITAVKEGYGIEVDTTLPFSEEVLRVLNVEIGIMQNDLSFSKDEFKSMTAKSKKQAYDYEQDIVSMEGVIERPIKDGIMLDKYMAYQKQAKKIYDTKVAQAQKQKHGTR